MRSAGSRSWRVLGGILAFAAFLPVWEELEQVIRERLSEFWEAGIRGADFFISVIGPAVGVFGRYRKVMRPDGQEITVENLLDEVRTMGNEGYSLHPCQDLVK